MVGNSLFPKITLPTRISGNSCTLIDNLYCKLSSQTLNSHAGIIVTNLSDHYPCYVSFTTETNINSKTRPQYVKQRVNSESAKENLLRDLERSDAITNLNRDLVPCNPNPNYNIFEDELLFLKNKHLPYKLVKFNKHRHKQTHWITYGIIKSMKYRDKLHLDLKREKLGSQNYLLKKQNLRVFNNILRKAIREAKRTYFNSQFNRYKHDIKKTWQTISEILSPFKKSNVSKIIKNNKNVENSKEIADAFNEYFVNIGPTLSKQISDVKEKSYKTFLLNKVSTSFNFELINVDILTKVIKSLKTKNSAGPDGISTKLLKYLSPALVKPLTLIINQSIISGIFPDRLKIAKVLPLYKKDDKFNVENYRPISLLSAISKLFERVVFNQLYAYFVKNKLFYPSQYGFRDKHSTEFAAVELVDRVMEQLDKGNCAISIFMDLSKAFDTLDHKILLQKLRYYGLQNTPLRWFDSYLTGRLQYVEVNGACSDSLPITTGVPQGSILGPLLFIIYMNDIPNSSSEVNFILYADDTSIFTSIDLSNIQNSVDINNELHKVSTWLRCNKLSLNISKTKFMFFHHHKKNIRGKVPEIKINNTDIARVQNFNFLGININENLSWKSHCDFLAGKLSKVAGILNKLKNWVPYIILKTIYYSLFQSYINYGILLWGYECNRIFKLQKRAIRSITRAKYNAHTEPLFKLCAILKLNDLLKLNALKFYYKYCRRELPVYFNSFIFLPQSQIHTYPTRHGNLVRTNSTRTFFAEKCLRNYLPLLINSISAALLDKIHTHSIQSFARHVKNSMFDKYEFECSIVNCYICNN